MPRTHCKKLKLIAWLIIITALQIIPLETPERLTVLPAHAYSHVLSSEEQINI